MASFSSPIVMFCSGPQVHPVTARAGTSWRTYSTRGGVFLFRIPTLIFSAVPLVPTIPTRTSTSITTCNSHKDITKQDQTRTLTTMMELSFPSWSFGLISSRAPRLDLHPRLPGLAQDVACNLYFNHPTSDTYGFFEIRSRMGFLFDLSPFRRGSRHAS